MDDKLADVQVFETTDYGKFTNIDGNREIKKSHLKFLTTSFEKKDLGIPVIVNENFEIIDGQHRMLVFEELGLRVLYIMKKGFKLEEVHILNTNKSNWTMNNFMNSYADLGKKHYVTYREFHDKYKFGHYESIIMLSGGISNAVNGSVLVPFKEGEFEVIDYDKGVDWADRLTMVGEFYQGFKMRPFVIAMMRLFNYPGYNHTEFLSKLRAQRDMLYDVRNVNSYLRLIEDIYNYRRSAKTAFYQDLKITR